MPTAFLTHTSLALSSFLQQVGPGNEQSARAGGGGDGADGGSAAAEGNATFWDAQFAGEESVPWPVFEEGFQLAFQRQYNQADGSSLSGGGGGGGGRGASIGDDKMRMLRVFIDSDGDGIVHRAALDAVTCKSGGLFESFVALVGPPSN